MVAALPRADGMALDTLPPRDEITAYHLTDEHRLVGGLIERSVFTEDERRRSQDLARRLVHAARASDGTHGGIDAFMREYGLSSEEGVILMCLAEALLRIPDAATADRFIAEKISGGAWEKHLGASESLVVNASTWGLMLTGRIVKLGDSKGHNPFDVLKRLVARSGEPVIRQAIRQAVRLLGDQFVFGTTIREAIIRARDYEDRGYRFSYDMLGEAARSEADAERYFQRYVDALDAVGMAAGPLVLHHAEALYERPGLSVKLSALHPRFEPGKEKRLAAELLPRLLALTRAARTRGLTLTIDAEEQDRLEITLDLFAQALRDDHTRGWNGLGLAVQAYSKRAIPVLRWLRRLAADTGRRIPVRLVKGAYWDSEIKLAQERGLSEYPVFTRKLHTDLSYLAAMRLMLSDPSAFYAGYATHNAHTLASAHIAGGGATFEYQRLHGMGEALYAEVVGAAKLNRPCRIYAPVGGHEDLLSYLVRRLLENGANTSFVNRLADDEAPVADIIADPVELAERDRQVMTAARQQWITRPRDIYMPDRAASPGLPLSDRTARRELLAGMQRATHAAFSVGSIIDGTLMTGGDAAIALIAPHDRRRALGTVRWAGPAQLDAAIESAEQAALAWDRLGGEKRAEILELAADIVVRDRTKLLGVLVREAGKTLEAAQSELRETIDFLRYYAGEARRLFNGPVRLPGPTGEVNTLELRGRGVFGCISPWNFPLAIFTGQIAAALAAGNSVVAKAAEQTPITAFHATRILHEAGVPVDVLHLVAGGPRAGEAIVRDTRVSGIAFTGSNETAWSIQRCLADRRAAIIPFIAETGGINAMIADSSALSEQVVRDCVRGAFDSAGQRCSATRVLFLQDNIASRVLAMLDGGIRALDIGDPMDEATDIGPLIDEAAQDRVEAYKLNMQKSAREIVDPLLPAACRPGTFVTPAAYEIGRMDELKEEIFGPVLHVVRYEKGRIDKVVAAINAAQYGLTLSLHSRIESVADYVAAHARIGNFYVNRNQIGAVVGVQPFGGEGLSGTGPKAGGPNYVMRFATERVRSTDITATGGNLALLSAAAQPVKKS